MGVSIWEGNKSERVATALEAIKEAAESIAISMGGSYDGGWGGVPNIIRSGLGRKAFPVGTIFTVGIEASLTVSIGDSTGITAATVTEDTFVEAMGGVAEGVYEFTFDGAAWHREDNTPVSLATFGINVTGTPASGDHIIITEAITKLQKVVVDHDNPNYTMINGHNMILYDVYCIYNRQCSPRQALVYAATEIPAGTYYFTVKNQTWYPDDNDVSYQFTLTQAVPEGGQIVLDATYDQALAGKAVKTYSGPMSSEVIETATLTAGSSGTNLGNTDGNSANVNHMHRALMGNNYYAEGKLDMWFNSAAAANAWDAATTKYDRPCAYANVAGYMHNMDAEFLAVVQPTDVVCRSNNTYEEGHELNTLYTITGRKFFSASRVELGYGAENDLSEGRVWELFNGATDADRIKYDLAAKTTARYYWLRSPYPSHASSVRNVYPSGSLNFNNAYSGIGAAAACVIA